MLVSTFDILTLDQDTHRQQDPVVHASIPARPFSETNLPVIPRLSKDIAQMP